jgi:hypothetical protein
MKKISLILITGLLVLGACKKSFLDTEPNSGNLVDAQVRELSQSSPTALLKLADPSIRGIYAFMRQYATWSANHDDFGQKAVDLGLDLTTEDMVQSLHNWFGFDYLMDNREPNYRRTHFLWNFYYKIIYNSNVLLDQIDPNTTNTQLRHIRGQALAMRGYAYHYLVQLFAKTYKGNETGKGVPIYNTAADLSPKGRATIAEVYDQIISDLTTAVTMLQGFARTNKEAVDQKVANGFLARAYLSMERWSDAELAAKSARQGYTLMSAADYRNGFNNIGNVEWMWGSDITAQTTTIVASFFSQIDNTSPGYAGALQLYKLIDKKLYDRIPASDVRKLVFNDPARTIFPTIPAYAQLKFRDPGSWIGDYVYMRSSEMILIEAEAVARQGRDAQAQQILFELAGHRNPTSTISTSTGATLIDEIILQKRIELWGEGRTFLDLKRLNRGVDRTGSNHRADAVLVVPAGDPKFTYKIPQREIDGNINIPVSEQNP